MKNPNLNCQNWPFRPSLEFNKWNLLSCFSALWWDSLPLKDSTNITTDKIFSTATPTLSYLSVSSEMNQYAPLKTRPLLTCASWCCWDRNLNPKDGALPRLPLKLYQNLIKLLKTVMAPEKTLIAQFVMISSILSVESMVSLIKISANWENAEELMLPT